MEVKLRLSTEEDAHIIKNLYPLYLHDISEFDGSLPNRHGLIGEENTVTSLAEQGDVQSIWWRKPEALYPFLIRVDGCPAGFSFVATPPFTPNATDFVQHEFFIVRGYRRRGVGTLAAVKTLNRFRDQGGLWEVVTYPDHVAGTTFWRNVLNRYTAGEFSEREGDHPWGRRIIYTFRNGAL